MRLSSQQNIKLWSVLMVQTVFNFILSYWGFKLWQKPLKVCFRIFVKHSNESDEIHVLTFEYICSVSTFKEIKTDHWMPVTSMLAVMASNKYDLNLKYLNYSYSCINSISDF